MRKVEEETLREQKSDREGGSIKTNSLKNRLEMKILWKLNKKKTWTDKWVQHLLEKFKWKKSTMECHYSIIFTLIVHHDKYDNDDDANNCLKHTNLLQFYFFSSSHLLHASRVEKKVKIKSKEEEKVKRN